MGVIGRYIDGLTDAQRDRVVREQHWNGAGDFVRTDGSRCLVGIVEDMQVGDLIPLRYVAGHEGEMVWVRFDALRHRFGLDRVVRCVKLRAGASIEDLDDKPFLAPTRETAEAGAMDDTNGM